MHGRSGPICFSFCSTPSSAAVFTFCMFLFIYFLRLWSFGFDCNPFSSLLQNFVLSLQLFFLFAFVYLIFKALPLFLVKAPFLFFRLQTLSVAFFCLCFGVCIMRVFAAHFAICWAFAFVCSLFIFFCTAFLLHLF